MHIRSLAGALALTLAATTALADMPKQDTVKAGKDHPLLSRFAGSKLVGYAAKESRRRLAGGR
jgi:OmpA-OmpF porin, OOP family